MRIGSGYEIPNKVYDIKEHKKLQLTRKKEILFTKYAYTKADMMVIQQ